jgi:hypothetical protein
MDVNAMTSAVLEVVSLTGRPERIHTLLRVFSPYFSGGLEWRAFTHY